MSLFAATRRVFRPSALASTSRALATAVETPGSTGALADAAQASPLSSATPRSTPLPRSQPPTAHDDFVHVPLTGFYQKPAERMVVPLPASLFNVPSRPSLLHKIITAYRSSLRAGTASTKNRAEVNYSGKKMRPQKGTGRARLGDRGSPMLKGGGRAFGPRAKGPDGWKRKINRKEEQLGLKVSLSDKWRRGNLAIVDKLALDLPKTRLLQEKLGVRGWEDALFVTSLFEEGDSERAAFALAAGNLPSVAVVDNVDDLTVWEILRREKVVLEVDAVDQLIERVDPEGPWVDEMEEEMLLEAEAEAAALVQSEFEALPAAEQEQRLQDMATMLAAEEQVASETRA
ncbi:hypothetical protein BMF94_6672 [Rhodotorula taiwanensis]|uniref:Large ribosomal subunit protein uL4m n=1 Tax=Rhodotorula taiwanensis TaxID=741276 RepID=A0A2S5B150_9BASI|nr:hypothetical protein BMF94_6672 [Rhodotorula taiwanensis]